MVVCAWIYRDISGHVLSKFLYVYYVSYKKTMLPINHMVEMAFASSGKENSTNGKLKCRSR